MQTEWYNDYLIHSSISFSRKSHSVDVIHEPLAS